MNGELGQEDILEDHIVLQMKIAGWINLVWTILLLVLIFAFGALVYFPFAIFIAILGSIYLYRSIHLNDDAWRNTDTLIILLCINFLLFPIGSIPIAVALHYRRKVVRINSEKG